VQDSWAREEHVQTPEDFASIMHDQMPWHFGDPSDPRIADYMERAAGAVYSPRILQIFAASGYGPIELEDRLGEIDQPVLVLAGRHDRTCTPEAAEAMAAGITGSELRIFEESGHMTFVEEQDAYLETVRDFLERHIAEDEPGESRSVEVDQAG
jgi:proline iminopeptidase